MFLLAFISHIISLSAIALLQEMAVKDGLSAAQSVTAIAGLASLGYLLYSGWALRQRERQLVKDGPPGSLGLWWIGEMLDLIGTEPAKLERKRRMKYGENYTTHMLLAPLIRCGRVEDRQRVFRSEVKGETVNAWPDHWQKLLGSKTVTVVSGPRHVFLRKFFAFAFTPEAMRNYVEVVDGCICSYLNSINDGEKHSSVDFKVLALDIFMKTVFGAETPKETLLSISKNFTIWLGGFGALVPIDSPFFVFGRAMNARRTLMKTVGELVANCDGKGDDLLAKFVSFRDEHGEGLTQQEVEENILLLMFAGHDTTAASLGTMLALLFQPEHAHVLEKLRAELDPIDKLDDQQLKNCIYLGGVMDEAWRFVPPVGGSFRLVVKDMVLSDGYIARTGVRVGVGTASGHHDERFWGTVNFDPDRFIRLKTEAPEKLKQYYYPFGGGNRLCAGEQLARLETRIFLYRLARYWDVEILSRQRVDFPMYRYVTSYRIKPRTVDS
jgi:cytochrome P450